MSAILIIFYFLAAITLSTAFLTIYSKNPIHSAIYLVICFFSIAGHYLLFNAQFLAIVHIIVYSGAIMVLFLFVLMLLNLNDDSAPSKSTLIKMAGVIAGMCLVVTLAGSAKALHVSDPLILQTQDLGLVKNLGKVLFKNYVLPFEISSVLFLSAMIGAVVISKKEA